MRDRMSSLEMTRVKLVGRVIGKPSIIIGSGIACKVTIRVPNDTGTPEIYDIIISRGYKPWRVEIGTKGCAVGILRGGVLWADYFRSTKNVYQLTEQIVKTMDDAKL